MARAKTEMFDEKLVVMAAYGKALGHPARIEILRHLLVEGELPCMVIVDHLPLSQPACSRHINELLRVGLLESREDRTQIFFRVSIAGLAQFRRLLDHSLRVKSAKISHEKAQPKDREC